MDQRSVFRGGRRVCAPQRARCANDAFNFNGVLDAERDPMKLSDRFAAIERSVRIARQSERGVVKNLNGCVDRGVHCREVIQVSLHQFARRDLASTDQQGLFDSRKTQTIVH